MSQNYPTHSHTMKVMNAFFILYFLSLFTASGWFFPVYTSLGKDRSIWPWNWSILPGPFQCVSSLCRRLLTDRKLRDGLTIICMTTQWYSSLRWQEKTPGGAPGAKLSLRSFFYLFWWNCRVKEHLSPLNLNLWFDLTLQFAGGYYWLWPWSSCVWVRTAPRPLWLSAWESTIGPLAFQFLHGSLTVLLFSGRRKSKGLLAPGVPQPAATHILWPFQLGCLVGRIPVHSDGSQNARILEMGFFIRTLTYVLPQRHSEDVVKVPNRLTLRHEDYPEIPGLTSRTPSFLKFYSLIYLILILM